ncbi:MAG: ankyrin repeat domain-containing protein [Burkholderiales bacterium]|nr:ankyrin repeat domain-containing protein [Burkholderiales bacterium]
MAIQVTPRVAVYAGVAALVVAGAAAWFLFLQDEPAPPPAAKKAPAAKPAAETKAAEPAKSPAAPKAADTGKAAPAKPAAKPIPTDPDRLVAEIVDAAGLRRMIALLGPEIGSAAFAASQAGQERSDPPPVRLIDDLARKHFDSPELIEDIATGVKSAFEAERMGRLLELLRQPIAQTMAEPETPRLAAEERQRLLEELRRNPPPAARQKLVQTVDEIARASELGVFLATLAAREMVDAVFEGLQKAGRRPDREARQRANAQIGAFEPQLRAGFRALMHLAYRGATDEALAEYAKLLESETGRWGWQILANAMRAAMEKRVRPFAREVAELALERELARRASAAKQADAAPAPAVAAPKAAPVAAAPTEPPGYQRPANIRPLYSRYNDLVTAVVMRDAQAVKELLADGKNPDARQSDGLTVLMVAVANGDAAIVELLLAHKADPNLRAPDGRSALAIARSRGDAALVRLLERHGARG